MDAFKLFVCVSHSCSDRATVIVDIQNANIMCMSTLLKERSKDICKYSEKEELKKAKIKKCSANKGSPVSSNRFIVEWNTLVVGLGVMVRNESRS